MKPTSVEQHLDLIEVEALVDRHEQAEVLEGRTDDLRGRDVHELAQLGDGEELVHPHRAALALLLLVSLLLLGGLLFGRQALTLPATLLAPAPLQLGHDALDVRVHRVLIDPLALLALLLVVAALAVPVSRKALGLNADLSAGTGAGRGSRHRATDRANRTVRHAGAGWSG